jgi:hypothetical protein
MRLLNFADNGLTLFIGKARSSPGIRSNEKMHLYCSSSARMAVIVCANEELITTLRPMEQHNDGRRISHQPSKRNDAITGRLIHQLPILLSCTRRPWPTYLPLQEVVPGDRRMSWPTDGKRTQPWQKTIIFDLPSLPMHMYRWSWCSGWLLYKTRCSWWNSAPAI